MQRYSPALAILLLVPFACEKQRGSTTTPSEPTPSEPTVATSEPESAPVEDEPVEDEPVEDEALEEMSEEDISEEDQALWDEMLAETETEMDAELDGSSGGGFGGRGNKVPQVRPVKHTVEGNLDADVVRRIVRAHISKIRACYNAGLAKDETLAGTVTVEFTIGGNGLVKSSNAVNSDAFPDATVVACVVKAVEKWQFPKPTGGGVVKVVYPFVLEPG